MAKPLVHFPFPSDKFKEAWNDWLQYRREEKKKQPYTERGLNRVFNTLIRISNNDEDKAIKCIHFAMDKGWEGLFAIPEELPLSLRKDNFYKRLIKFKEKNPGLYPSGMYKEFFEYWAKVDDMSEKLAFEKINIFNFEERLKNWFERADKEHISQLWKQQPSRSLNLKIFNSEEI